MPQVRIVVDSPADVPPDLAKALGITVVPLTVHFGEKSYRDGVDLTPSEFYKLLEESPHSPTTSQPSPGDFAEVYRKLTADGSPVVSMHISSGLSGTYAAAVMARDLVGQGRIEIIDTRLASMVYGLVAIEAAQAANAGKPVDEVVELAKAMLPRMKIVFAVDTLEYLARNGRIGKAQALLGTMLSVKPLLTLEDGLVAPLDKVRGEKKVISRMVERLGEMLGGRGAAKAAVGHADCPARAEELKSVAEEAFGLRDILMTELGAVIGAHAGPGTLYLTVCQR